MYHGIRICFFINTLSYFTFSSACYYDLNPADLFQIGHQIVGLSIVITKYSPTPKYRQQFCPNALELKKLINERKNFHLLDNFSLNVVVAKSSVQLKKNAERANIPISKAYGKFYI